MQGILSAIRGEVARIRRRQTTWVLILIAAVAGLPATALAQADAPAGASPDQPFVLHADSIRDGQVTLPLQWRFRAGHDPGFADPAVDDGAWALVDRRLPAAALPEDWDGHGWFRLHLEVDSSLHHRPIGLRVFHLGASELYVDGRRVAAIGTPSPVAAQVETRLDRQPRLVSFEAGARLLAVRYAEPPQPAAQRMFGHGFVVSVVDAEPHIRVMLQQTRRLSATQFFFVALFTAFALLHLVLFAFHRQAREHLWFGLLAVVTAALAFGMMQFTFLETASAHLQRLWAMTLLVPLLGLVLLRFTYVLFYDRLPRQFYLFLVGAAGVAAWTVLVPERFVILFVFMIVACIEVVRATIVALVRRRPGARVLGFGLGVLAVATTAGLLQEAGVLPIAHLVEFVNPVTGATVLVLAMSVHLSRQVARTNADLAAQLEEVRRLSEEQLRQERRAREAELQHQLVEAENARRARELEGARQLQLSMLPAAVPEVRGLEIETYMRTATEVGGDYYDFAVCPSGSLTVVVGDATGHGMRAGTVVTAAKSLLATLGDEEPLDAFLTRASRALGRLRLPGLYMGLVLARWSGRTLQLASAGMPPVHVWRAAAGSLQSVTLKAIPIGGPEFPYRQVEVDLAAGDVVLLMTDGLAERFNRQRDEFGYDEAARVFARAAADNGQPGAVIERLVAAGEEWAGGAPPEDDVTFVVLRVR